MLYLDLDELDEIFEKKWFWSVNRFNLASFYRKDHLCAEELDLKTAVCNFLFSETGYKVTGPIRLLTHLRYFGYCFNPISLYYIFNEADTELEAIIAEVNNTPWGDRHCYTFVQHENQDQASGHYYIKKKMMHVSPLMDMNFMHHFDFTKPSESLKIMVRNLKGNEEHFNAKLHLNKRSITTFSLTLALITYPLMTFKVIFLIYLQAALLWLKGAPFNSHPNSKGLK